MNKIFLIGNISSDIENTNTADGLSIAKFSIAVQRRSKDKGTDFFNVVCFRALADTVTKYLQKGKKASIVGALQIRKFQAKDGTNRYSTEIIAEEIEFLSPASVIDKPQLPELQEEDPSSSGLPF